VTGSPRRPGGEAGVHVGKDDFLAGVEPLDLIQPPGQAQQGGALAVTQVTNHHQAVHGFAGWLMSGG